MVTMAINGQKKWLSRVNEFDLATLSLSLLLFFFFSQNIHIHLSISSDL